MPTRCVPARFSPGFSPRWRRARRGLHHKLGDATYLIDATSLPLSGMGSDCVHFSSKSCGVKAHVIYDANAEHPIYAAITPARVNDIKAAQQMPIEPGATYVFDLAYYDFAWWASTGPAAIIRTARTALIPNIRIADCIFTLLEFVPSWIPYAIFDPPADDWAILRLFSLFTGTKHIRGLYNKGPCPMFFVALNGKPHGSTIG
jgi:hypothetical protein